MASNESKGNDVTSSSEAVAPHSLVTEDHVRAALIADKGADARLTCWRVVDFNKKGDNYVCEVISVEVEYVLDGQSSEVVYVVKINPFSKSENEIVDILCDKEAKVYLTLVPQMNSVLKEIRHRELNLPRCLYASLDNGKQVLFMEDLRQRGYKMLGNKHGMDKAHATLVLKELAKLHAASLLLLNQTPGEDLEAQHPYIRKSWYEITRDYESLLNLIKSGVKFAQEIMKKVEGYEKLAAWIDTVIPNIVDILSEIKRGEPKVVCHGDCWNNNCLFRYSEDGHPEEVMLIDLQMAHYVTPPNDLHYLFFTSMTGDVRKTNTETFLAYYYSALSGILKDAGQKVPFTQGQLLKDFRNKNLSGVILGMYILPVVVFESEDTVDSSQGVSENLESKVNLSRQKILDTLDSDPVIKARFLALFDDIIEMGLIE